MGFWDFVNPFDDFGGGGGGNSGGGGGGVISAQPLMPDWQMALGENLSSWVQKFLSMYNPGEKYPGQLSVKTPSAFEQKGLSELDKLLAGPATGELFGAAKGQVMDTLSGKYADPSTSPFIQSTMRLANQNLQDAINKSRAGAGARGTFFSRSALQEESNLTERTQNLLNTVIGDFMNQERGRQQNAVPMAESLEKYGTLTAPLARIGAATTTGALPRVLEQADLERQYDDYLRGRKELGAVPNIGTSVFGRDIPYGYPDVVSPVQSEPSGIASILQALNSGGGGNILDSLGGSSGPFGGGGGGGDWQTWANLAIKYLPMFLA